MNQLISKTDINLAVKNIKYMGQDFISPGRLLSEILKDHLRVCLPAPERKMMINDDK